MKHLLSTILIASLVIAFSFTVIVQVDVMRDQLHRIGQLEQDNKRLRAVVDDLIETLAGIKIEKVPDDLLIH
ncbi:hypothetical protein LCGC14_2477710 [marine sediment metagenome]|uniref:Uncharacterized protein n=1 Tax=marine sediment metagenome TaxID=412755 RepID=A0A0F9BWE4_9ZZZZ